MFRQKLPIAEFLVLSSVTVVLAGCGGGGGSGAVNSSAQSSTTSQVQSVGGSVDNLTQPGLTLSLGGQTISVSASTPIFSFPTPLVVGTNYEAKITSQPELQTCTISNPTGTVGSFGSDDLRLTCSAASAKVTIDGVTTILQQPVLVNGHPDTDPSKLTTTAAVGVWPLISTLSQYQQVNSDLSVDTLRNIHFPLHLSNWAAASEDGTIANPSRVTSSGTGCDVDFDGVTISIKAGGDTYAANLDGVPATVKTPFPGVSTIGQSYDLLNGDAYQITAGPRTVGTVSTTRSFYMQVSDASTVENRVTHSYYCSKMNCDTIDFSRLSDRKVTIGVYLDPYGSRPERVIVNGLKYVKSVISQVSCTNY